MREELVTDISEDRRSRRRYAIDLQLQYKIIRHFRVAHTGAGRTINMSSHGIAWETDERLEPGDFVELSVIWPVLLNRSCPLKLVISGRVVRSDQRMAAIRIVRHEFRTQGSRAVQAIMNRAMASGLQV